MATSKNHTGIFKKILVEFIGQEDPILAMLEWTAQQMMQVEEERTIEGLNGDLVLISLRSSIVGLLVKPFFGTSSKNGFWV